jgi:hypothetical protein
VDQQLTTFQLLLALALPQCLIISFSLFSARVDPSRRIKNKIKKNSHPHLDEEVFGLVWMNQNIKKKKKRDRMTTHDGPRTDYCFVYFSKEEEMKKNKHERVCVYVCGIIDCFDLVKICGGKKPWK